MVPPARRQLVGMQEGLGWRDEKPRGKGLSKGASLGNKDIKKGNLGGHRKGNYRTGPN